MKPCAGFFRCCSHGNRAGQELCYLCHQRTQKNVPIYFTEERRRKELEQDRLLQQYQHQKDAEAILKEQVRVRFMYVCMYLFIYITYTITKRKTRPNNNIMVRNVTTETGSKLSAPYC